MTRVFTRYIWLHIVHQLHALLCECVAIPETNSVITIRSFIIKEARSRDNTIIFLVLYHDNFHGIILHTEIRGKIPCFFFFVYGDNIYRQWEQARDEHIWWPFTRSHCTSVRNKQHIRVSLYTTIPVFLSLHTNVTLFWPKRLRKSRFFFKIFSIASALFSN